jgi:CRP-like cAMP-binding protein
MLAHQGDEHYDNGELSNILLRALWPSLSSSLKPHLSRVVLERDMALGQAGQAVENVYFPASGLISLRAASIDVGAIGCEGVTGLCLANGVDRMPYGYAVQIPGIAYSMESGAFSSLFETSPHFRKTMLLYTQTMFVQITEHAICNAKQSLQVRVARWLLLCHDRIRQAEINITHAALATALCVRRAGVTDALHVLEGMHAVYSRRGSITIRDRNRLVDAAQASYGTAEAEYRRLFPIEEADLDGTIRHERTPSCVA